MQLHPYTHTHTTYTFNSTYNEKLKPEHFMNPSGEKKRKKKNQDRDRCTLYFGKHGKCEHYGKGEKERKDREARVGGVDRLRYPMKER